MSLTNLLSKAPASLVTLVTAAMETPLLDLTVVDGFLAPGEDPAAPSVDTREFSTEIRQLATTSLQEITADSGDNDHHDLGTILGCVRAGDGVQGQEVAHQLKGNLDTIGCGRASRICLIIESRIAAARPGDGGGGEMAGEIRWLMRVLLDVFAQSQRELDMFLWMTPPSPPV